jgi:hypothetical protein
MTCASIRGKSHQTTRELFHSCLETMPMPSSTNSAVSPAEGSGTAPAATRPLIDGAPDELASRDACQFGGHAELGEPAEVVGPGAPGRIRTADASLRTAALYPLSYGGVPASYPTRCAQPGGPPDEPPGGAADPV